MATKIKPATLNGAKLEMLGMVMKEAKANPFTFAILFAWFLLSGGHEGFEMFTEGKQQTVLETKLLQMQGQINLLVLLHQNNNGATVAENGEIMINPKHLEELVIKPTLTKLAAFDERMNTPAAVQLTLGTMAQETSMGYNLKQIGGGPGLGPYSMEPATHRSLWEHYLNRPEKQHLREIMLGMVPEAAVYLEPDGKYYVQDEQLVVNFEYATAMARLKYWPVKDPLPDAGNLEALGQYWDTHYNANPNVGTVAEFVEAWKRFVARAG